MALVSVACLSIAAGCGHGKGQTGSQTSCKFRSSRYGLDVRHFTVSGGETCRHANAVIARVEGLEGGCGRAGCHVLGLTCFERPGGLASNGTGGSAYAYSDGKCASGIKRASWRTCFSILKHGISRSTCPAATTGTQPAPGRTPALPRIHEGFTLLPCPQDNSALRGTTVGLEGCAEQAIVRTDKNIIANERTIFLLLRGNGPSDFANAERSWLAYRAAYCNARASSYKGGSVAPVIFGTCQAAINRDHLRALFAFRRELRRR